MNRVTSQVFELGCAVQCYAWGKAGSSSEVANLSKAGNPGFELDEDKPYAELWMGTHPKGPSTILKDNTPLSTWVAEHPQCLGSKVRETFPSMASGQLPFLFKVLSVGKSLSIQAHPNKTHAEELHSAKPDKYPDPNHKPEMAIALTRFKAMCGFRPKQEVHTFLKRIPELAEIVGKSLISAFDHAENDADIRSCMQKCFTALMMCSPEKVKKHLSTLVQRLKDTSVHDEEYNFLQGALLLQLNKEFPGDVGCFCIYFLNVLDLQAGEAIFLEANLPHAYLQGDCIECMACSDNVVRAGLTPKFKDVDVLCSMLNYQGIPASQNLFNGQPHPEDPYVTTFDPPIPDFAVDQIMVPMSSTDIELSAKDGASILLVISGNATGTENPTIKLTKGSVLFVAANQSLTLSVFDSILMFRAYCTV